MPLNKEFESAVRGFHYYKRYWRKKNCFALTRKIMLLMFLPSKSLTWVAIFEDTYHRK